MWRARFFKALPKILDDYPGHKWIFLTLTVRNCQLNNLRSTVTGMSKSWNKFSKYKAFPGVGWVRSLEVTRGKDRSAHPHYHCLIMVQPSYFKSAKYLSNAKWRELWQRAIVSDYLPVVNVKTVKPCPGDSHPMIRGILECLKYGVKESDLLSDSDWLDGLTSQMDKLRSIALGGVVSQYLREDEPEDLIHSDEEDDSIDELLDEYPEVFFDWRKSVSRYVMVD
jgi:plasmid rolling circle replication initiator protein Rep